MRRRLYARRNRRRRRAYGGINAYGSKVLRMRTRRSRIRRQALVHHFRRGAPSGIIQGNVVNNPYLQAVTFTMNSVLNWGEFSALYDQFRLNYVVTKYWLKIDPSAQTAATASYPKMYFCRDLDDSVTPSNLNELRERGNCRIKVMNPNRPIVFKVRPNVLNSVYRTGLNDGSSTPLWKQWIDVVNADTIHYGYKLAIDDLTNTNYRVDVEQIFYFSCKNTR